MELKRREEHLYFHRPWIGPEEKQEILDCLDSGWLTTGPRTKAFEKKFAEAIGVKHAIALNSCTAGLHLALIGLDLKPGDEVITTPLTFVATANVIVHSRGRPVFVDVDRRTGNIDPAAVERAITPKTRAILIVHYVGHPCDMDALCAISKSKKIDLIEDAAHAVESEYKGRRCGNFGRMTAFSFYATKNITTGEGGMLVTNEDALAERLRILSLHGMNKDAWKRYSAEGAAAWQLEEPGFKYNMFDIQAALGLHQLDKVEKFRRRREEIVLRVRREFADIPALRTLEDLPGVKNAYHLMPIYLTPRCKLTRDQVIQGYKEWNVGTGIHFDPVHLQPFYRKTFGCKPGDCPVAEEMGTRTLSLPLYPKMSDDDVQYVIDVTRKIFSAA